MPKLRTLPLLWLLLLAGLTAAGCVKVGPDFVRPPADVRSGWLEEDADRTRPLPVDDRLWWTAFRDPVLDRLVETATTQNIPLRVAGARVFEARARLGIAVGEQYPQLQQAVGEAAYVRGSERAPSAPQRSSGVDFDYRQVQVGASAAWELDFWGRFRRAVESEDAGFLGSIAAYDSALVSLAADVARVYVLIRTHRRATAHRPRQRRDPAGKPAHRRGPLPRRGHQRARRAAGAHPTERHRGHDPAARCCPAAGRQRPLHPARPAAAQPGRPPRGRLRHPAGAARGRGRHPGGPAAPPAGHPLAELQAAAQSARIGVAKADLYPAFSLNGTFGFLASDVGRFSLADVASWNSRTGSFGPAFTWNLLNYGQITNRVRVQDARFQELIFGYQDAVLRAQQEVEDGLAVFLQSQQRLVSLEAAAAAAKRSADLALIQYREGATDYTTVLTAQAALLQQQDSLANAQGDVPQGLIAVYRALGGGWEVREGRGFLPADITAAMGERTDWGGLLAPDATRPRNANASS